MLLLLATAVLGVSQGWLFTIVGEGQNQRTNERKKKYNVWKFRSKSICVFLTANELVNYRVCMSFCTLFFYLMRARRKKRENIYLYFIN